MLLKLYNDLSFGVIKMANEIGNKCKYLQRFYRIRDIIEIVSIKRGIYE